MSSSTPHLSRRRAPRDPSADAGITALEAAAGIAVIATIVALAVWSSFQFAARSNERSCGADAKMLATAADVYFAQTGNSELPAIGEDADRFERTLIDADLLGATSVRFDLRSDGSLVPSGDDCG